MSKHTAVMLLMIGLSQAVYADPVQEVREAIQQRDEAFKQQDAARIASSHAEDRGPTRCARTRPLHKKVLPCLRGRVMTASRTPPRYI